MYFPTRTLYFTHKIEYRERCRNSDSLAAANKQTENKDTTQSNINQELSIFFLSI